MADVTMDATDPDGIAFLVSGSPINPLQESAQQASTIQQAFDLRYAYDYHWATVSDRTGQTGMRAGDTGFQVDIAQPYWYLGAAGWQPVSIGSGRTLTGKTLVTPATATGGFRGTSDINFPSGYFATEPVIQVSQFTANPQNVSASYTAASSAGFTLVLFRTDNASATTLSWTASQ